MRAASAFVGERSQPCGNPITETTCASPVLSSRPPRAPAPQPGLPALAPAALDISETDLGIVRDRTRREGLVIQGYRFQGDTICKAARFETLERELGDAFVGTTLPDSAANPKSLMAQAGKPPHSVFTGDLVDAPHQPTREAVDEVIAFFRQRLGRALA
jgi:hypothetical protein